MYDIVVIGSGPAGLTSAIYSKRAGKKVLVLERGLIGGQVATIAEIENYPGFLNVQGGQLAEIFYKQAKGLGVEFKHDELVSLKAEKDRVFLICKKGTYEAKAVILALGSASRELNVEGEKQFLGKGVSYCATCDGNFFKNKDVIVAGSGDSAVSTALYLLPICKSVSIVSKYPNLKLKAYPPAILDRLQDVKMFYSSNITAINGTESVESVKLDSQKAPLKTDGIFVAIGRTPDTQFLKGVLELDEKGYIKTDEHMHTSMERVYACGDVIVSPVKQIVTATATGAIAATEAIKQLSEA